MNFDRASISNDETTTTATTSTRDDAPRDVARLELDALREQDLDAVVGGAFPFIQN